MLVAFGNLIHESYCIYIYFFLEGWGGGVEEDVLQKEMKQ